MQGNRDKFIEVFGKETYDTFINGLMDESLTQSDILYWFLKDYQTPIEKRRPGRPRKSEVVEINTTDDVLSETDDQPENVTDDVLDDIEIERS